MLLLLFFRTNRLNPAKQNRINIMSIKIGRASIFDKRLTLIAGPCVIPPKRDEKVCFLIAESLKNISLENNIPFIFKASYDKANRTSYKSYRGVGLKKGLSLLAKIKKAFDIPVLSDVHSVTEVKPASEVIDVIQIPALLSRQTDLLIAAAKTGKPINIKKGQFMAPEDIYYAIEKIRNAGNNKIIITERGTTFGYHTLINDMRAIPIMKKFGYPIIFDATHSVQMPGAGKGKSSGNREMIPCLAKAAVAAGADGVFFEVYPQPEKALCDSANSLHLGKLNDLLKTLIKIRQAIL